MVLWTKILELHRPNAHQDNDSRHPHAEVINAFFFDLATGRLEAMSPVGIVFLLLVNSRFADERVRQVQVVYAPLRRVASILLVLDQLHVVVRLHVIVALRPKILWSLMQLPPLQLLSTWRILHGRPKFNM